MLIIAGHIEVDPRKLSAGLFDGVHIDVPLIPREAQNALAVTHLVYDVERPTAGP